ncbi:hypothetical protein HDV02_000966 [Globomyces sp. JEL0801]|nr:hypothetical protein HDV02_000966 [Globomyces sp. JEL0801]
MTTRKYSSSAILHDTNGVSSEWQQAILRNEIRLMKERTVSQTEYPRLFRKVKEAKAKVELELEIDAEMLTLSFATYFERQMELMKEKYYMSIDRIRRSGKSEFANKIVTLFRTYEIKRIEMVKLLRSNQQLLLNEKIAEISRLKKQSHKKESSILKHANMIEKYKAIAKRSGCDLEAASFNQIPEAIQLDQLDYLHKTIHQKEEFLNMMINRIGKNSPAVTAPTSANIKRSKQSSATFRRSGMVSSANTMISMTPKPVEPKRQTYTMAELEGVLLEMKKTFEEQKEKELALTKETEEDFRIQFIELRMQTKDDIGLLKSNCHPKIFEITRDLFQKPATKVSKEIQCD